MYTSESGSLTDNDLDRCRDSYISADYSGEECVMGVDVGKVYHAVIRGHESKRLWTARIVEDDRDLDDLMARYNVKRVVVDSQPEHHLMERFAQRHPHQVILANYNRHEHGVAWSREAYATFGGISINRSEALEKMTYQFKQRLLPLPRDVRTLGGRVREGRGEYYRELLALRSTLVQDANGNWDRRWLGSAADHFAHAELYCMYAQERPGWEATGGVGMPILFN